MSERNLMKNALIDCFIPFLRSNGFEGHFPHFYRINKKRIELLSISFDKLGGAFSVIASYVIPNAKNTNLPEGLNHLPPSSLNCFKTVKRQAFPLSGPIRFCDAVHLKVDGKNVVFSMTKEQKDVFLKNICPDSYTIEKIYSPDIYNKCVERAEQLMPDVEAWWKAIYKQSLNKNNFFKKLFSRY